MDKGKHVVGQIAREASRFALGSEKASDYDQGKLRDQQSRSCDMLPTSPPFLSFLSVLGTRENQ